MVLPQITPFVSDARTSSFPRHRVLYAYVCVLVLDASI